MGADPWLCSRSTWLSLVFQLFELDKLVLSLIDKLEKLVLAQVRPGGGLAIGETFAIQRLIFEMELFLHGFCQTGKLFLNKMV